MSKDKKKKDFSVEEIRRLAREGRIEFAPGEQIEYLQQYVQDILEVIADVTGIDGIRRAFVSDQSCVGDFFTKSRTTDEEYRIACAEIGSRLGVELDSEDISTLYLVEIARKMAHG